MPPGYNQRRLGVVSLCPARRTGLRDRPDHRARNPRRRRRGLWGPRPGLSQPSAARQRPHGQRWLGHDCRGHSAVRWGSGHSPPGLGRAARMQDYLSASTARRGLVVSNLFPPHGAGDTEVIAYSQARQLRARGHVVSVFAGRVAPPSHAGRLEVNDEDGLRVWRTPVLSFEPDDDFCTPTIGARLQSVLEADQPDLVHFHNLSGLGFSLIPPVKRYGLPAIVTLHDHAGYCYRATALRPDGSPCREPEECALACSGAVRPREVGLALPMRLRRDYVAWALAHADRLIAPSDALAAGFRTARVADDARLQIVSNGAHGDRSSE